MSDYDWDDDDDNDGASGDTNAMKELRKAYKAMQKEKKELMESLDSLKSSVRDRSVKDVIASKGLPEKVAALIPKDATSTEQVEEWLSEYGEIFGIQAASEERKPAAPNPELQALNRIAATQSSGQPYSGDATQLDALIRAATTPEELNQILFNNAAGPQAI
jgi:HSP90 family molecular chaperone